jgi:2'-5' RNA ligase
LPRLFTALWPATEAVAALRTELAADDGWPPPGWRLTPTNLWHLTLCFHGDTEPEPVARRLRSRLSGREAPWLRLAGEVSFPGVLAVGLVADCPAGDAALRDLAIAAGADAGRFRAHLSVARGPRGRVGTELLRRHRGPWWRPSEVCLVRSELGSGPPRYTVLDRVPLVQEHAWSRWVETPFTP